MAVQSMASFYFLERDYADESCLSDLMLHQCPQIFSRCHHHHSLNGLRLSGGTGTIQEQGSVQAGTLCPEALYRTGLSVSSGNLRGTSIKDSLQKQ